MITGKQIEMIGFFILMSLLTYAVVYYWIVEIHIIKYLIIELLILSSNKLGSYMKKQK